jgi:hypothetical protein
VPFERKKYKRLKKMTKCSPSLAIKEMQIKTTLIVYFIPVRIATIKNANKKCWRRCGRKELSYITDGNVS